MVSNCKSWWNDTRDCCSDASVIVAVVVMRADVGVVWARVGCKRS
jgi:hypothetical protein